MDDSPAVQQEADGAVAVEEVAVEETPAPPEAPVEETPAEPEATPEPVAEETPTPVTDSKPDRRSVERLFRVNSYVHVGPGAEECPDGEDGTCGDPLHFHAFCRLPNKFQIAAIRTKANAAKARARRRLRDPESDQFAILEGDLDDIREAGKQALVEEVLSRTYFKDHQQAMKELTEEEDSPFATIEEDQERFKELNDMAPEDRPEDEFNELIRHLDKWNAEVDRVRDSIQLPQKEGLEARDDEDLIEIIRDERIKLEADNEYMFIYSGEEWVACTLKPVPAEKGLPSEKVFGSFEQLRVQPPEVVNILEQTFAELESEFANRASVRAEGN